jgi:P-loop Domain of unknown function (DUF2791)
MTEVIRARDRDSVLLALRAGVVPRTGQHLIQVGRSMELESMLADIDRVANGGAAFRLLIGEYGSGKTFFLNLVRAVALERRLVVLNADLTPDRRLHASGGQARSLYAELMRNTSTRAKPEGAALAAVVEKFVSTLEAEAKKSGGAVDDAIRQKLDSLSEMVGGYDFAAVINAYWKAFRDGNDPLKADAVRWLRGEFSTKTDARTALGVRTIVDDESFYDHLKLMARFVRLAGYTGLLVCLDEMVNLYKLTNTQARNSNYEQILRILNDTLQNPPEGFGIVLGGTPEFLLDTRRGLFSYPALQSRLAENAFAKHGLVDLTGPVLRLASLSPEDLYVLLQKLRHLSALGDPAQYLLPDAALVAFMEHCQKRIGETYFRTPRTTITAFANFLAVVAQNSGVAWKNVLDQVEVHSDHDDAAEPSLAVESVRGANGDDELTTFKL